MQAITCLDYLKMGRCPKCGYQVMGRKYDRRKMTSLLAHLKDLHQDLYEQYEEAFQKHKEKTSELWF